MTEHIASTKNFQRLAKLRRTPAGGTTEADHRSTSCRNSSYIETPADTPDWNEHNLPEWLLPFVQNRSWAIRFANLLNQGYYNQLRHLAEHIRRVAHTSPVRMMAVACSKARWENTLAQIRERVKVERLANEVRERLRASNDQMPALYAVVWRLKGYALRFAATAQEIGRDKFRFFCWLTRPAATGTGSTQSSQ